MDNGDEVEGEGEGEGKGENEGEGVLGRHRSSRSVPHPQGRQKLKCAEEG
jgi:hypothetical protein